jgi:hypothetical protein
MNRNTLVCIYEVKKTPAGRNPAIFSHAYLLRDSLESHFAFSRYQVQPRSLTTVKTVSRLLTYETGKTGRIESKLFPM